MVVVRLDLLGRTGNLLHKSLDAESLRFKVRADNFANVNTPGYKRQDVEFETFLAAELDKKSGQMELRKTHTRHLDGKATGSSPRVVTDNASTMRYDGNNVDMEQEMVALTETAVRYQVLAEQLTRQIRQLRTAISERVG
jgi:flagellar basal-body rod protein FlgB